MLPVLFSLGPITIYSLGVFLGLGLFLAAFITWRRLRDLGLGEEKIIDLIIIASVLGFAFSKLVFFLKYQSFAGFSFWGGLVGVFLGLGGYVKLQNWDFWQITDEVVFGILPFSVLAHLGAFLDGSCLGKPTNAPWGVYFPGSLLRTQPVTLFSAVAFFLIWLFLHQIERQWRFWRWYSSKASGLVTLAFLTLAFLAHSMVAIWHAFRLYWYWLEIGLSLGVTILSGVVLYHRSGRNFSHDVAYLFGRRRNGKSQKEKG